MFLMSQREISHPLPAPLPALCGAFTTTQGREITESTIEIPFSEGLFAIGLDPDQCDFALHISHTNISTSAYAIAS